MKQIYKGYEIIVDREKCLGGWSQLYFSVFDKDGYGLVCDFEESGETVKDKMNELKELVDIQLSLSKPWESYYD